MADFPARLPRSTKAARGRTGEKTTPLVIRSSTRLDDVPRETVRARLGRSLASALRRTRSPKARATRARVRRPN